MNRILSDIWDGIRFQPGRTGLSFLAIAIGMISLTVLLALLGGLKERSRQMIREMGANVFAILPQRSDSSSRTNEINETHATLITANLPDCTVSQARRLSCEIPGVDGNVTVIACDENMPDVRQWDILTGRFFDAHDSINREKYAVITRALGNAKGMEIGQVISIKNEPFTIIGIISYNNDTMETESPGSILLTGEKTIFVPLTTSKLWLDPNRDNYNSLDTIFVRVAGTENLERILSVVQRLFTGPYEGANRFEWLTPEVLLRGVRRLQATIAFTVGSVAFLCIILGGTTLMSLMVANVRDRVTEIGLRRALGATPSDISMLFVMEACLVTGLASLTGTSLSHLVLLIAGQHLPSPIHLDTWTLTVPVLVSIILGILFSYGPARMAANISPSEALRND